MSTYREDVGDNGRIGDETIAEEATASAPEQTQGDGDRPVMGLDVCPHFALLNDPDTSLLFPSSMGHCHRAEPAAPVRLAHQERFCLTGRHRQCPVFRRPEDEAAPIPAKMRGRAAPAARRGRGWARLLAAVAVAAVVLLGIGWGLNLTSINGEEEPLPTRASVAILPLLGSETPTLPATSTAVATAAVAGETAVATASPSPSAAPTLTMTPAPTVTGTAVATSTTALTPTLTPTPPLTSTPTVTATSTTPTATATTAPVTTTANVVVTVNRVNARTGPGLDYPIVTLIENGAEIPIVGQLNDGTWWQICCIEGREAPLWVFGETVDVQGDAADVPVVPIPPLPTATPAP